MLNLCSLYSIYGIVINFSSIKDGHFLSIEQIASHIFYKLSLKQEKWLKYPYSDFWCQNMVSTRYLLINYFKKIGITHIQGVSFEKWKFQMAVVALKWWIFDPMLVMPKCVWEVADFFSFLKICLHLSADCLQFFKKSATSQTHFGFTNIGSNTHRYRATAI